MDTGMSASHNAVATVNALCVIVLASRTVAKSLPTRPGFPSGLSLVLARPEALRNDKDALPSITQAYFF
jgi:hypothetical protein